jgi:hypothetical protein
MRQTMLFDALRALGFSQDDARAMRKISSTLRRWFELECGVDGGGIERDEATGKPYWVDYNAARPVRTPVRDREAGAMRRLKRIFEKAPEGVTYFIQGDCRGAALYVMRPGDVPAGASVESCYTRGLCVY